MDSCKVLVIYDSEKGATRHMAEKVAKGAALVKNVMADVRSVADVTLKEMLDADAYAFGTPNHFGTMSSNMKDFFRKLKPLWEQGSLRGRPAAVFTASGQYHGGAEIALLTMMVPLFSHGLIIVGLPPFPRQYVSDGCFLGAKANISNVATHKLSDEDLKSAALLGERLARTVVSLRAGRECVKEQIADKSVEEKKPSPVPPGLDRIKILVEDGDVEAWQCVNCAYVHHGEEPPDVCPLCNLGKEYFDSYDVGSWECTSCGYVVYSEKPAEPCPVCGAEASTFMPYCG